MKEKINLNDVKEQMENIGYYPTRQLVLETALGIKAMQENGQVGQGIHAICLSGPPGAGKSFYAKTYKKILEKELKKEIHFVKYSCNTSTGKSELYEEINITEAVVDSKDREKIILPGKVLQAIDLVNEGKNVILFLDEYDKAREETDTFLLDFLQDGEINTTQRGMATIKEECLKNLQVIVCKNDYREELSGPLTRRLKFIELDYMKPDILCKAINYSLKDTNQSIRDSVTLLYAAIYDEKDVFLRLPACSECMQAIKDSETLMNMGANKKDIVTTAIIANMFKNEDDIEIFEDLVKKSRKGELIQWYDCIIDAVGKNDEYNLNDLKAEMARSFYPEQLKNLNKELEEKKSELNEKKAEAEKQKRIMEDEAKEYNKKKMEIEKEKINIQKKEAELKQREKETAKLRENATKDAIASAETFLNQKIEEIHDEYGKKEKMLKQREEQTQELRLKAEEDAIKVANKKIEEKKRELEEAFIKKEKALSEKVEEEISKANDQIRKKNEEINNKLIECNYTTAKNKETQELLREKEASLIKQKKLLEKLLGREVKESDFDVQEEKSTQIEIDKSKNFVIKDDENEEIQKISTNNSKSVFDYSNGENWTEIGEIILERGKDKEKLKFTKECTKRLGRILTDERYEKQKTSVCDDGIVLYQGNSNRVIAVRIIEKEEESYSNLYKFYSNTMVTPIQALQMIANLIGNLNACGINIITKETIETKLNCLIYSNRKHRNNTNCEFEEIEDNTYYLNYINKTEKKSCSNSKISYNKRWIKF